MLHNPIIGLTSGVFDLLHYGHLKYLERCRALCDKLIVAVDCDEMAREVKGEGRPIQPARERRLMLQALECVDMVCVLNKLEDLRHISTIFYVQKVFKNEVFMDMPIVIGVHECSAELIIVPDIDGLPETTDIINTVKERFTCSNGDLSS